MFIKSGREFSSSAIIFLFIRTRDRTEDITDNGVGLSILRGTRRSSSIRRVARALYYSKKGNGSSRVSESYVGVTEIF
jgi:hypothetical protein